jgi:hypothetical protein
VLVQVLVQEMALVMVVELAQGLELVLAQVMVEEKVEAWEKVLVQVLVQEMALVMVVELVQGLESVWVKESEKDWEQEWAQGLEEELAWVWG